MTVIEGLIPALLGLGTGFSLIVAIGAQNAFVLRLGIEGRTKVIALVVAVCALSDALLILAGILGIGALLERAPAALIVIRILGAGFLLCYGVFAAVRVFRPKALVAAEGTGATGSRVALATVLALTWLNPHVYLDTIVFLGSIGNQQGADERWWWAGGAMASSLIWFTALGFGARLLRPIFARPSAWRVLDGLIAIVMISLGLRLAIAG